MSEAWLWRGTGDGKAAFSPGDLTAAQEWLPAGLVRSTLPWLQSPRPPPMDPIPTSLANDPTTSPKDLVLILILDDRPLVPAPAIDETAAFMLSHALPQIQNKRARGHPLSARQRWPKAGSSDR